MATIYVPRRYGGHSLNCLAWQAVLRPIKKVDERSIGSTKFVEIVDLRSGQWLGLVPSDDLMVVSDVRLTKKKKLELFERLELLVKQKEAKLESAAMRRTGSDKWHDNPVDNPRPIQADKFIPVSYKSTQNKVTVTDGVKTISNKFRVYTGGASEAAALQRFQRNYSTGRVGKKQVKEKATKAQVIGDDIADEHFRIGYMQLIERLGL